MSAEFGFIKLIFGFIKLIYGNIRGYFRYTKNEKIQHDRKIFDKVNGILNDEQIQLIIRKTGSGYFPDDLIWATDGLEEFVKSVSNEFMSKELQDKIVIMSKDLGFLADFYVSSPYSDVVGKNNHKLLNRKEL